MTIASALKSYAQTEPHPPDAAMVMKTAEYPEVCNLIFERGILSKKIIRSMESPVIICNIKRGFQFFANWHEKHQRTGKTFFSRPVNIYKCQFLFPFTYFHQGQLFIHFTPCVCGGTLISWL